MHRHMTGRSPDIHSVNRSRPAPAPAGDEPPGPPGPPRTPPATTATAPPISASARPPPARGTPRHRTTLDKDGPDATPFHHCDHRPGPHRCARIHRIRTTAAHASTTRWSGSAAPNYRRRRCAAAGSSTPRALPLPGSGTSAAPVPDPSGSCHPRGDPDLTPHGPGTPAPPAPEALPCQGPPGRRTRGTGETDHEPAPGQPGTGHAHHHRTTTTRAPPPEQAPSPEPVVAGCLYEAGFTTTGPHPQGGVAIARSIDDARQRLADMLIFCDPTAAATADITAFTPTTRSPGTAAPSPNCSPTSTPAPRTAPSTPDPSSASPPHAPPAGGDRDVPDPGQRRHHRPPHPAHRQRCSAGTPPPATTPGTSPPATNGAPSRTSGRGPSPTSTATQASSP